MQSLDLTKLPRKTTPAVLPQTRPAVSVDGALPWCLLNYNAGPCPSDGRNTWLAGLALFCNEKGVPEADLEAWALAHGPLASHGEKQVTAVIRGVYKRKRAAHGTKAYHVPREVPDTPLPTFSPRPSRPAATETNWLPELLNTRLLLQKRSMETVAFARPLFFHDDEPVIWPRTLNLIQGQTGAHKSRVAELFSAILIAETVPVGDAIGITRNREPGVDYTLCYVDTERSVSEQLPYAIQQMRERAGYPRQVDPPTFDYISLEVVPRAERLPALRQYLAHVRRTYNNHLVIVLDVLTDCISSFNDEKESLLLVDLLNRLINTQDVTFLCVIHENPGGVKARGHLGTEAANKASTVLQVGYLKQGTGEPGNVIELRYLKRRNGRPGLVHHVTFDEASKGLVRADPEAVARAQQSRRSKADAEPLAAAVATELAFGPLASGELENRVATRLNAGQRTIRVRLQELVAAATSVLDVGGRACVLHKAREGKQTLYSLRPTTPP